MSTKTSKEKNKTTKVVKAWWLRKGEEGFLTSNLWMNGANARLQAKGYRYRDTGKHTGVCEYKVILVEIHYKISLDKSKKK